MSYFGESMRKPVRELSVGKIEKYGRSSAEDRFRKLAHEEFVKRIESAIAEGKRELELDDYRFVHRHKRSPKFREETEY
jgi:hypothetical protein